MFRPYSQVGNKNRVVVYLRDTSSPCFPDQRTRVISSQREFKVCGSPLTKPVVREREMQMGHGLATFLTLREPGSTLAFIYASEWRVTRSARWQTLVSKVKQVTFRSANRPRPKYTPTRLETRYPWQLVKLGEIRFNNGPFLRCFYRVRLIFRTCRWINRAFRKNARNSKNSGNF